jgi:hypothetical protein
VVKRSSTVLLVAGAAGLFVTLGVLVHAVHSEAPETEPTVSHSTASQPNAPASVSTSSNGPIASRDPVVKSKSIWKTPMFTAGRVDDSTTASAPIEDENAPPGTSGNKKNLEFGGTQLRAQTKAVGHWVQKCVDEAKKKGATLNGTAMLTYVVAKHGDKYEVEDSGIDEDKTTLQNTELLDCMRTTAFAMHFEGLPREATGIVASRSVTLKDGVMVEYKHVSFSYLR